MRAIEREEGEDRGGRERETNIWERETCIWERETGI